jgi:hypothetical protein
MKVFTKRLVAKSCDYRPGRVYLSRYSSNDGYAVCNVGTQPPVESRREPWTVQGICECCCSAHARELERDFRLLLAAKAQSGFKGFRLTDYEADALFCLVMEFDRQFKGPSATDWPRGEKLQLDWLAAIVEAGKAIFKPFPRTLEDVERRERFSREICGND